ncbi:MAG: DEAD/DEAH box helicase [Polyangiaceae bacterium]
MSNPLAAYRALSKREREALRLLAIAEPVGNRSQLLQLFKQRGIRTEAKRLYTSEDLAQLLDRWGSMGLVGFREGWTQLRCASEVGHNAIIDPELESLVVLIAELKHRGGSYYYLSDSELRLQMRLALYARDESALLRLLHHHSEGERGWQALLGEFPPDDLLALIPAGHLLLSAFRGCVPHAVANLQPVGQAWAQQLPRVAEQWRPALATALALTHLLSGRRAEANALLDGQVGCEVDYMRVALEVFFGDAELARKLSAEAITRSRGEKGRRKPVLLGPGAPWAALALALGNPAELAEATALISRAVAKPSKAGFGFTYAHLVYVTELLQVSAQMPVRAAESLLDECFGLIILGSVSLWGLRRERTYSAEGLNYFETLVAQAETGGYGLLATELSQALSRLKGKKGGKEPPSRLASLRTEKAAWEQVLESLERAAEKSDRAAGAVAASDKGKRLVWDFAHKSGRILNLSAREQTLKKSGWSTGRAVALSRLEAVALEAHASPQDRRVIAHLRKRVERVFGRRQLVIQWDASVVRDLVGHPLVYDQATGERLEIVAEKPRLELKRTKGGFELEVKPGGLVDSGTHSLERAGRIEVYEVSDETSLVARALAERSAIPAAQEARLQRVLGSLASSLRVDSDMAIGSELANSIPADERIHVLCWRSQPGLRIRLAVRPLGDGGPALPPGEGSAVLVSDVHSKTLQTTRDLEREVESLETLLDACPTLATAELAGRELRLQELEVCYEALTELARLGDSIVMEWPRGQPLTIIAERGASELRARVSSSGEWLRAEVQLEVDEGRVLALREIVALFDTAAGRFIQLGEDRILALSNQLVEKIQQLEFLGNVRAKHVEIPALAAPALEEWLGGVGDVAGKDVLAKRLEKLEEAQRLQPEVPRAFEANLRDYQLDGFTWMRRLAHWGAGALLCDDMGLGKTIQVLALLTDLEREGPALIVAPTSVCAHWEQLAARFAPSLRCHRLPSDDREAAVASLQAGDVLIVSYGLLQREAELLAGREFAVAVLDEAQAIKNASSLRARAAHGLRAPLRVISSGTPVENHLGELWSLFEFANPGLLGSSAQFDRRFARPIQERGDRRTLDALRRLVRPFILRRTKAEVLTQLPDKTEITLRVEMSAEERAVYEALRREALEAIDSTSDPGKRRMLIFATLMRLRQAACHPRLVHSTHGGSSSKHEVLMSLVDELREGRHRALVFSQFVEHLGLVRETLNERNVPYLYLDGSTPAKQRPELVRRFQAGEGDLFLISLRAGGTGLDLTAADFVVHLDPWWNPAVESQASDRAHRIGQQRPVTIYRLVTADTVEERILAMHGEKRATAERLLEGTSTPSQLDADTLRELIASH